MRLSVVHDGPVSPIPASKLKDFAEPQVPYPEGRIWMPELKSFKTVLDRFAAITTDEILLTIENDIGKFIVEAQNEFTVIKTIYQDLAVPKMEKEDDSGLNFCFCFVLFCFCFV